jgi:adenine-specific DNA methylase
MAINLKKAFSKAENMDEKSLDFLTKALQKGNLPGFDYLEFKQSLEALHAMNMDESLAFQSAFATASTMGLTKEKLLKSVSHYQKVLEQEKSSLIKLCKSNYTSEWKSKGPKLGKWRPASSRHKSKFGNWKPRSPRIRKLSPR